MNHHSTDIAARLVRGWVRLYTVGLPAAVKTTRRDEIASDVWEQTRDASHSKQTQHMVIWQMLGRMVFGMPDDLFWRAERSREKERGTSMNLATHLVRPRTYVNLVVVLVGMFVLFPVGIAAFVSAVVASIVPPVMLSTVFIYKLTEVHFGFWTVDTLPEAIGVSLIGLVLVLLELLVANAIVSVLRRFVSVRIGKLRFGRTS